MEKHLRVLNVTLDYPPPVLGGYGVMCAQVCSWLKQRGHEALVLTTLPPERETVSAGSNAEEGAVLLRRILRSYWDGSACLDPPLQEALVIEQHNQVQMQRVLAAFHPDVVAFWHMQFDNWLRAGTSASAWWKVGFIPRVHSLSIARRQALSARSWPLQAFSLHNQSRRPCLPFGVVALDQVDGIKRTVDRVMPPEEEAGKRHDLAVTVGQECRDETRHRPVQQNPEPPTPGNEEKKRHEDERSPEGHGPQPGLRYPLAKLPEEDEVQSRSQEQAACHLANRRRR